MSEPKYSKTENSQKFNLKTLLGKTPTQSQRDEFKELVVDKIISRTLSGEDIGGETFEEYSETYAKKKGVTTESVDLFLDGEMLPSIDEVEGRQKNILKVAVEGEINNLKAYNHNIGDTLPQRTFFGVTDDEVQAIVNRVKAKKVAGKRKTIGDIIDQIELGQIE